MYLTGGATAVLEGWRESTVDIDVRFEPDSDAALSRISEIKDRLEINVKLASPLDFLRCSRGSSSSCSDFPRSTRRVCEQRSNLSCATTDRQPGEKDAS
jgi:hypothetical protein